MNEEYIPYQQMSQPAGAAMPPQIDRKEFIDAISNKALIEETFYTLQGYVKRKNTWIPPSPNKKFRVVNEEGADAITDVLRKSCSTATSMGDYSEEQISRILFSFSETLWNLLVANKSEFGIVDGEHMQTIVDTCFYNAYSVWSHGKLGGFQEMFGKMKSESSSFNYTPPPEKKGIRKWLGI